jgi:hypothetical protein
LVLVAFAAAPSAAPALTGAERKAANAKAVEGASTAKAAYVEIRFAGDIEATLGRGGLRNANVKIKLMPTSGRATVITESGPSDEPEKRRRGTKGVSEIVRSARTMYVLVKGLPTPARKAIVTVSRRGDRDRVRAKLPGLITEPELEFSLQVIDSAISDTAEDLSLAEYKAFATAERIQVLKKKLARATKPARVRKLRTALRRQKNKLAKLNERRRQLGTRVEFLGNWLKVVEGALDDAAVRECEDGADNTDGEDSLADFPADFGCVMRTDAEEANATMPFTCPTPGKTVDTSASVDIAQGYVLERFILERLNPDPPAERDQVVDAPVEGGSGGPYPVGLRLCGYYIDVTYGYRVHTDGAPAGTYRLTVALHAVAESVTENPGGQNRTLVLAAGTTR